MKAKDVRGTKSARIVEQRGRVLPKTVHVKYEWESDDPFLEVAEQIEELVEKGDTVYVGEYRLVNVRKVTLNLKVE